MIAFVINYCLEILIRAESKYILFIIDIFQWGIISSVIIRNMQSAIAICLAVAYVGYCGDIRHSLHDMGQFNVVILSGRVVPFGANSERAITGASYLQTACAISSSGRYLAAIAK